MDDILNAFVNPTVWVGIFLTFVFQYSFKHLPKASKSFKRKSRLKQLKKIKNIRQNPDLVTFHTMKAHAYYLVFMGTCALILIMVIMGPLTPVLNVSKILFFIVISPVFITEVIWLNQSMLAQEVIEHREKLRVTRRLNGTKTVG